MSMNMKWVLLMQLILLQAGAVIGAERFLIMARSMFKTAKEFGDQENQIQRTKSARIDMNRLAEGMAGFG